MANGERKQTRQSEGDVHVVVISEGFVAIWTFARSRSETFLDAIFAENMPACLYRSVFEIPATHSAKRKSL